MVYIGLGMSLWTGEPDGTGTGIETRTDPKRYWIKRIA